MRQPCAYIMESKRNGTIYVGATSDLPSRVWKHRNGFYEGFTKRYGVQKLVWYETHTTMQSAILKEKQIKRWRRKWKMELIEEENPQWRDLYDEISAYAPLSE